MTLFKEAEMREMDIDMRGYELHFKVAFVSTVGVGDIYPGR